ncbi:MAG: 3-phosphoshikimate 1-carboxyvinyltransferase [Chitinophagales bacterium]|nr:3-phosphoshikimate 1-carboxyvinyltransferase [Chitinophagales bacterium]MDW8394014.1 3-phosphoshikimate 1-carboxyvinyltransferase [Chitinophagales bacterium]
MSRRIRLIAPQGPVISRVALSGSKSIANRVLIMQALAGSAAQLHNFPDAGDSQLLQHLLRERSSTVDARDAGTVYRFLTAFLSVQEGEYVLTGTSRMLQRPIGDLVDALLALGADITYAGRHGFPPLRIRGSQMAGGTVTVNTRISSQFASALLLIGPVLPKGLTLVLNEPPVSAPYLQMTVSLMQRFGINVHQQGLTITVPNQPYRISDFFIEPDWSSASYWYEIAALSGAAEIVLPGLTIPSLQGDARIADFMTTFGVHTEPIPHGIRLRKVQAEQSTELTLSLSDHPDLAPALFATAAGCSRPARFFGLSHLRYKESNRAEAFATELQRCQIVLQPEGEALKLSGTFQADTPAFYTYNDHRLAMALAPLCLRCGQVIIHEPDVVNKSYPNYWRDLQQAGFSVMPC